MHVQTSRDVFRQSSLWHGQQLLQGKLVADAHADSRRTTVDQALLVDLARLLQVLLLHVLLLLISQIVTMIM